VKPSTICRRACAAPVFSWAAGLWVAACSSSTSVGAADATPDSRRFTRTDAGDGAHGPSPHRDGGAADARPDGTRDGSLDAKPDRARDGAPEASSGGTRDGAREGSRSDGATDARPQRGDATGAPDARDAAPTPDARDAEAFPDAGVDAGPPALRYVGRVLTDGTSPDGNGNCTAATPCFEWSGTQVIARFTGATAFDLRMSDYGSYFDVYVDGALQPSSPVVGDAYQSDYPIAAGLDPTATHVVSLYKRTEASSNGRTMILGYGLPDGGTLLPPGPAATRRIEVVGDSISCGYGVLGPDATCVETSPYEDHDVSYGAITARNLGADLHTVASSGRGVFRNVDGTTTGTLPDIYSFTLPYVEPDAGPPSTWDFATWVPDAVVINLGTDDYATGNPAPDQTFEEAYLAFLQRVRASYPDAYILCTNGPMLTEPDYSAAAGYIQEAIAAMSDANVAYLAFPAQEPDAGEGCDGHPGQATHEAMAEELTTALQRALGW
jgi:lysophospholipase L1-like esterase